MFSVVREEPRSALRSIQHGAQLLRGTGRALWMFPQGALVQQDVRPIICDPGLAMLARLTSSAWLAPVAFRYELLREQRPDVLIKIGTPEFVQWTNATTVTDVMNRAQVRLTEVADQTRQDAMTEDLTSYRVLYQGARSMEKTFDTITNK